MLEFWVIVVALLCVVLALILPTLIWPNAAAKADARAKKRDIFLQQFDEIEQDKINGVLDEAQYEIAKSEMERRLLDEIGATPVLNVTAHQPDRRLAIMLTILLPLLSVLLYLKLGNPDAITLSSTANGHNTVAELEPLLNSLKEKLDSNPGDGEGWALLARSYVQIGRFAEAVSAYEKAVKAIPDDPQLLADYADIMAVVNGNNLLGKPEALIHQALKIDPHNIKALMLAATIEFDRKDYKKAAGFLETAQQVLPPDSDILPEVKASLNEAYALSGKKISAANVQKAETNTQTVMAGAGISGTVRIVPELANKLDPSATLFVFARAAQGAPMPVAIVKTTAGDLPFSYQLDDSSAIMADKKLSQVGDVIVVARISKSGSANPQSGDFEGTSATVKSGDKAIDIEINRIIP